jgi:hypothetical protein
MLVARHAQSHRQPLTLARAWRRQLYGASGLALIVPGAMLAALFALVLAGAFSQVGVLDQVFAGPSLPAVGTQSGQSAGTRLAASMSTSTIPLVPAPARSPTRLPASAGGSTGSRRSASAPSRGVQRTGGAVNGSPLTGGTGSTGAPGGGTVTPVSQVPGGSGAPAPAPAPVTTVPPPIRTPSPPARTPVQTIVTTVTSVTQQLPPPVGAAATGAVQAAGAVAEQLLPIQDRAVP